jgi:hypothetical protein
MTEPIKAKWTPIDKGAADEITRATDTPGVVYPVGTNALPAQLQQMPGAVSYFISAYTSGIPANASVTAGGEFVVVRTDGELGKAYNFVFGTSSDGQVCINGPYKAFPAHHFASTHSVPVSAMFRNTPIKG